MTTLEWRHGWSVHKFKNEYINQLYHVGDHYQIDEMDTHEKGIKVNGCQGQVMMFQVLSWVAITMQVAIVLVINFPLMREPGGDVLYAVCTAIFTMTMLANVSASLTQSADDAVFGLPRWTHEEFDEYLTIKYQDLWNGSWETTHPRKNELKAIRSRDKVWCSICHSVVSIDSYHCHSSNKCVYKMDHFCKWLNVAVGEKNYHFFALFVFGCYILQVTQVAVSTYQFVDTFTDRTYYTARIESVFSSSDPASLEAIRVVLMVNIIAACAAVGELGFLIGFHGMLLRINATTQTYWAYKRNRNAPDEMEGDSVAPDVE